MNLFSQDRAQQSIRTNNSNSTRSEQIGSLIISFCIFISGILILLLSNTYQAHKTTLFISGFTIAFTGMMALRHFWLSRWGIWHVLILSVSARILLFPVTPSDDLNRHIWEGNMQLHGMNPYSVAPDNQLTVPLRNEIWEGINHREFTSIYGPLFQIISKGVAIFWYSPFGIKMVIVLFDIMTILLLALFMKHRGSRINELLLYAVNPLVLYSFAAEGHLEAIILCMLAASAVLHQKKKYHWMFVTLGCACTLKLTSLIYIPLFIRKDTLKFTPLVLIPVLFALPYGTDIITIFDVTIRFAREFRYNGLLFKFLSLFLDNNGTVLQVSTALFATVYAGIFFLTPDPVRACRNVSIAFLLSSPTAHAWYFTIVALYVVLFPARSWIILTGTMGLSWLTIFKYWTSGHWKELWYTPIFEYLPPLFQGLYERLRLPAFASNSYNAPERISIIVPVLNEAQQLRDCLESIYLPEDTPSEILVVDGGSHDSTVHIAQTDSRVRSIQSEKGRGIQISRGIEEAKGDLIIVLHADSRLDTNAITEIVQFCKKHPHVVGGSVASRFDSRELRFCLITALNNIRSRCTGISFGDQVQFFRHTALINNLPKVKLMEDIEISMRLKECGTIAVLPSLARSSIRRWEKRAYSRNIVLVIWLTALYIIKRRFGQLQGDNADFYEMYYGKL